MKKLAFSLIVAVVAAGALAATNLASKPEAVQAAGGDPIFMKFDGIDGEVTVKGHENEIELLSWSWGMDQGGISGGGGAGKVNVHDITMTKQLDKSSPKLMEVLAKGEHARQVELSFSSPSPRSREFMRITLENVIVTSYQISGSASQDRPAESLSLNFEKIKVSYQQLDKKGTSAGAPKVFTWDVAANNSF